MLSLNTIARRFAGCALPSRAIPAMLLVFSAVTACSSDDDGPSGPDGGALTGRYALLEVDGDSPPVTIFDKDVRTEDGRVVRLKIAITDGSLQLDEQEDFYGELELRITVQGQSEDESISLSGEYAREGTSISFESDDPEGPSFEGTFRNGRLELEIDIFDTGDSFTYTFKK